MNTASRITCVLYIYIYINNVWIKSLFNCRPVGSKDCAQGVAVPETCPQARQAGAHQQEHPSAADGQWEAGNEGGNWCQAHQVKKYSFSLSFFLFFIIWNIRIVKNIDRNHIWMWHQWENGKKVKNRGVRIFIWNLKNLKILIGYKQVARLNRRDV